MRASPELASVLELLSHVAGLPGPQLPVSRVGARPRWWRWMSIVDEQQLAPLLASRTLFVGPEGKRASSPLPLWIEDVLIDRYARSGHEAAFRSTQLIRILNLFDGEVSPAVLKGSALAMTLYADAAERPMSDFDLLLPQESAPAARSILIREGYRVRRSGAAVQAGPHHHLEPLSDPLAELTFELHTNLATPALPESAIHGILEKKQRLAIAGCENFFVLDPVSAVIHHAIHAVADPVDSPLLRNLFELAWLTSRLDRSDRATVRSLSIRWGIADRVSLAMHLAAKLFGSQPIFEARRFDLRARWCLARLEWTRSFAADPTRWERLRRDLARRHLGLVGSGASPLELRPLLLAGAESVKRAILTRLEHLRDRLRSGLRRSSVPERVELASMPARIVGGCLLAHDVDTGCVHLLDRMSTAVWSNARLTSRTHEIRELAERAGIDRAQADAAIAKLIETGLLRRAS